jgi:apolipoprotein N-acyltransferase
MPPSRSLPDLATLVRGNMLAPAYLWVVGRAGRDALLLAAGLGAIGNLAFAPVLFWPALMVALCGLVWLLDGAALSARPRAATFWRVFAFGFIYFLAALHWIASAFLVDPGAHLWLVWLPILILPAGLALILAAVITIGFSLWSQGPARWIAFTFFFMLAEWIRGALFGLGGLPWNLPGYVWAPGGAVSQSAALWGIYGLSLVTVAALSAPAMLVDPRRRGLMAMRAAPVLLAAIVLGALWGGGARRLATAPEGPEGPVVRLVETGTPQNQKYADGVGPRMLERFVELSGRDSARAAPIVVWPEGALPYFVFEWPPILDTLMGSIGDRRLIMGLARREDADTPNERTYNSLAVLNEASDVAGPMALYDKHMLVPFGEFMPGGDLMEALGMGTLQRLAPAGFTAGPRPASVRVVGVPAFAPMICYEAIFPGLAPAGDDRPQWLLNISNDAWFGQLSGPYQHSVQARYRSIEEGLPMARVAAGGFTGMIDAYGRWTARGQRADTTVFGADPKGWRSSVVEARIPPAAEPTPYSRWRDGLFWVMLIGINLGYLVLPRR